MKLIPLHDWAVIIPSAEEELTAGGLYIPDTAKSKPQGGVVEAVGPGAYEEEKRGKKKEEKKERKFVPTTVKPGDYVLYEKYAAHKYTIDGEERYLVRERDILGVLPERPAPKRAPAAPPVSAPKAGGTKPAAPERKEAAEAPARKEAKKAPQRAAPKKAAAKPKSKKR